MARVARHTYNHCRCGGARDGRRASSLRGSGGSPHPRRECHQCRAFGSAPMAGCAPGWAAALLVLCACASVARAAAPPVVFNITIPKDASDFNEEDAYLCTTLPLPQQAMKLVGIEPLAKQEVVHHILLFGGRPRARHGDRRAGAAVQQRLRTHLHAGAQCELCVYGSGQRQPSLGASDPLLPQLRCAAGCSVPHVVPKDGVQPVWDCKRSPTCGTFEETIL